MKYIDDNPVNLNEIDLLGSKKYSKLLEENILKSPENKSMTIGIFGRWGIGKSSIVETTKINLEISHPEIKFITYDAWKYTNDGFRRTFLMQIRDELKSKKIKRTDLANHLYSNILKSKYEWGALILIILFALVLIILKMLEQFYEVAAIAFIILILQQIIKILLTPNTNIQTSHYFSPEQFEKDFKTIIDEFISSRRKNKKIVITIDNIDRCTQEQTYQTLTDIRGFLDDKKYPIVFLIPIDDNALASQIEKKGDNSPEFMRKIFDVVIHIKPLKEAEMYDFVNEINEKEELNLKSDTMYIIADEFATNPRRIIKLLNNLQEELALFDIRYNDKDYIFSKKYETVICKLLIIREEWPEFYYEISHKPELLKNKTSELNDFNFPGDRLQEEIEKRKNKHEKKLITFLEYTKAITKNVDDGLIRELTRSHDSFKNIPEEIYIQLKEKDYNKMVEYIKEDEHFLLLCNYLLDELKRGVQRGANETKVPETFDHLIKINTYKSIESYNSQIENCIGDTSTLLSFITSLNELECLVKYTYDLREKHENRYLYDFIISELNYDFELFHSIAGDFYTALFLTFVNKYPNEKICKDLQKGFVKKYNDIVGFDYILGSGERISIEKIPYLISENFIKLLIDNIGSEDDGYVMNNLVYIFSIYTVNNEQIFNIKQKIDNICRHPGSRREYSSIDLKNSEANLLRYQNYVNQINENLEEHKKIIINIE